jgi:ferredoxin-thioredoxin reductase catalytic subunit
MSGEGPAGPGGREVEALCAELARNAEKSGYHLNPDAEFARGLARGLLVNEKRYGYRSCPCRLASGKAGEDRDIVCPCDYRDADLGEFGACFCALYVSGAVARGEAEAQPVPERRPLAGARGGRAEGMGGEVLGGGQELRVWRCRVCGYLCARGEPPESCPICMAGKERFERVFLGFRGQE